MRHLVPRRPLLRTATLFTCAAALTAAVPAASAAPSLPPLQAGAGQADITPPKTGYVLGGWTRADRRAQGQQSRLHAKTIVLKRGERKVALVSAELFMIAGGMQQHIAESLSDLGYRADNVLISATHTHSGPGGFANIATLNTAAPNGWMILTNPGSLMGLLSPQGADKQLYTFLVKQIASSIRQADSDLKPAVAGWGERQLTGLTQNRSLEAHLANHGLIKLPGHGEPGQDPAGAEHTIDPNVDVLRVDQVVGGRRVAIGAWSQFANHGTVVKSEAQAYSGDHHATATRVFEDAVRREGNVPAGGTVVNVYGNGAEGDQTAGLEFTGYTGAAEVGAREAQSMLAAWRDAGARLSDDLELDHRWTQTCFCGQTVEGGKVATKGSPGAPFLTGSEEGRGPLWEAVRIPLEGVLSPLEMIPGHGHKLVVPVGEFPSAVPLTTVRVGDRMIASLPGEATKEAGERVKATVLDATRRAGISKVVIAGLANEYINYITTPEEYDRQHYEGGSTMFGRQQLNVLRGALGELATALVSGTAAPAAADYDAKRGMTPDGAPYPTGATRATISSQPSSKVARLGQASLTWKGAAAGADRPVGSAFVRVQQNISGAWREIDSDLGTNVLWKVSGDAYTANWELPLDAAAGTRYRLVVTANHYSLTSREFVATAATNLKVERIAAPWGEVAVRVSYPDARENVDLRPRPGAVNEGMVTFSAFLQSNKTAPIVNGIARTRMGGLLPVFVKSGKARDGAGNTNTGDVWVR